MANLSSLILKRCLSTSLRRRAAESAAASAGEHGDPALWKKLFFIVCIPSIGLAMANCYIEHHEHEPPEFVPYEYMRIRNKRFPWGEGNKTLFHNPKVNALPDGYEKV